MEDVSLKTTEQPQAQEAGNDKALDNLIFSENKEEGSTEHSETKPKSGSQDGAPAATSSETDSNEDGEGKETKQRSSSGRSSLVNAFPVDKLKNGASTATKVAGGVFSLVREKSGVAYETAKSSQAGSAVSSGYTRATTAGSEQFGKLKETDAYKRSTAVASGAYDKARMAASSGYEMAKTGASTGYETIRSRMNSGQGSAETAAPSQESKKE